MWHNYYYHSGCYKELDCFGFPDIISDDFGSCCASGGTAYLDPLSEECSICPGEYNIIKHVPKHTHTSAYNIIA